MITYIQEEDLFRKHSCIQIIKTTDIIIQASDYSITNMQLFLKELIKYKLINTVTINAEVILNQNRFLNTNLILDLQLAQKKPISQQAAINFLKDACTQTTHNYIAGTLEKFVFIAAEISYLSKGKQWESYPNQFDFTIDKFLEQKEAIEQYRQALKTINHTEANLL